MFLATGNHPTSKYVTAQEDWKASGMIGGAAVGVVKKEIALVASLFLGVDALDISLRNSQRDTDLRGEIIYVPVNHNVYLEER